MLNLNIKARQFAIRDFIGMVKASYFVKALITQYNAIFNFPTPTFCYGYAENRMLFSQTDVFTASSTPSSQSISFVLSKSSTRSSSPSESHIDNPPQYTWGKDPYWWYYLLNGTRTGIAIDKITHLQTTPYTRIKLEKARYRILFSPPNDARLYHLLDCQSLKEAKKTAEWYYRERLKVNHDLSEPGYQPC